MLTPSQLVRVLLLPAFAQSRESEVGKELAAALMRSPGAEALSLGELEQTLRGYSAEVQTITQGLREKLKDRQKQQAAGDAYA